jgi:hypothetical protein
MRLVGSRREGFAVPSESRHVARTLRRGVVLLLIAGLLGAGGYSIDMGFFQPQYKAIVGTCFGGRDNFCDVSIRYHGQDVASRAYVESKSTGDPITVTAAGSPPWSKVGAVSSIGRWLVPAVLFASALTVAALWALSARRGGRRTRSGHEAGRA